MARIVSLEPPGKPSDEVVTISTTSNIEVTSIQSSDEKVIFQGERAYYGQYQPIGICLSNKVCQLPAGTYTIGADFDDSHEFSLASQYVTREFKKGHHYVVTCDYTDSKKLFGTGKWKLKVIEK